MLSSGYKNIVTQPLSLWPCKNDYSLQNTIWKPEKIIAGKKSIQLTALSGEGMVRRINLCPSFYISAALGLKKIMQGIVTVDKPSGFLVLASLQGREGLFLADVRYRDRKAKGAANPFFTVYT